MKMHILVMLVLSSLITCCKKSNHDSKDYFNDLKGTWYNTTSDYDAIIFLNDSMLDRKILTTDAIHDHYSIILKSDEITLQYTGLDKIYCPSSTLKYYLNKSKDTLVIDNFNLYYPYISGNKFYKSLNK